MLACLAGWLLTTVLVTAQPVRISIGGESVAPGGVARLAVRLDEGSSRPDTLVLKLQVGDTGLTFDKVLAGELSGKLMEYRAVNESVTMVFFEGEETLAPGELASLFLLVPEEVAVGSTIELVDAGSSAASADAQPLPVDVSAFDLHIEPLSRRHSADTTANGRIDTTEILRAIQLYNLGDFGCDGTTADGYAPGAENRSCAPHSLDFAPTDWRIGLSELLRLIQLYNGDYGAYHLSEESEDGFASGP